MASLTRVCPVILPRHLHPRQPIGLLPGFDRKHRREERSMFDDPHSDLVGSLKSAYKLVFTRLNLAIQDRDWAKLDAADLPTKDAAEVEWIGDRFGLIPRII